MKFSEMPYARPDIDAILARCKEFAAAAAAAPTGEALARVYYDQSAAMGAYSTAANLANIHYTCDTRDAYWQAEQDFFDQNGPAVSNAQVEIYRAILSNPHLDALTEAFGTTCVPGMKNAVLAVDSRVTALQQEANAISSLYQRLYGGALVELDGKQLTIPQLGPYKQSMDPAVRRAAFEAEAGYFDAHRAEFDELYERTVQNLNQQAAILGYKDYSELSYARMNRIGYGPEEIRVFRDQVARDVVPLLSEIVARRARRAGIENPTFADLNVAFPDGNPAPVKGYQVRMDAARVLSRPGKANGGYMTILPDYKAPFIFANWNDTAGDVDVLTHEAGHAFEGYLAARDEAIPEDLKCPSMESAEIHSMAMEFLTAPWHKLLFGADTGKYALTHAEESLIFLSYGCEVDEFQHIMYQHPTLTPDQRNDVWLRLEKKYRPWIDFDGLPFYGRGAGWQRQLHIYECPFYYIDYCLSTMAALQFFLLGEADHADAWQRYLKLCRKGGTASYTELCATAGLKTPFEEGAVKAIAQPVADWIAAHQV